MQHTLRLTCLAVLIAGTFAGCTTVTYPDQTTGSTSNPTSTPVQLQLTQDVAQVLAQRTNEVVVPNIIYVTQDETVIEGTAYKLLNLHTADRKVYRTRVLKEKLTDTTFNRLKSLKGATLIGVIPVSGYQNQYFFRNYKELKF